MKKIESFLIDHTRLLPGLYVSRRDKKLLSVVTTFDLRMREPNREPAMEMAAVHTIEHLGATFLRNSSRAGDVIYFGPMGCRTGFYLVMFGNLTPSEVYGLVTQMCDYILDFEGDIPGATPEECGNYLDQNLPMAKYYIARYEEELLQKRFSYPE